MSTTKPTVDEALASLGLASLAEFASLHGLQWMNLDDAMDRQTIETAVLREAKYQKIFWGVE
jgi:hypothetical protein